MNYQKYNDPRYYLQEKQYETQLRNKHVLNQMILQQYIEESSTDIHRLYQISTTRHNGTVQARPFEPQGSIILEYISFALLIFVLPFRHY